MVDDDLRARGQHGQERPDNSLLIPAPAREDHSFLAGVVDGPIAIQAAMFMR